MRCRAVGKVSYSRGTKDCGLIMFMEGFLCARHCPKCSMHITHLNSTTYL